jgi:hypothetical protein
MRAVLLGTALLVGCEGLVISPSPGLSGPSLPSSPSTPGSPAARVKTFSCNPSQLPGTTHGALRRLSSQEVTHTMAALLGPDVFSDTTIQTKLAGLPLDAVNGPGSIVADTPVTWPRVLFDVAKQAAQLGLASSDWRAKYLDACTNMSPLTDDCVKTALRTLGSHVFRRDLSDAEVTALFTDYATVGGEKGLGLEVRRLLQAPPLAFHLEDGTATGDGRIKLTAFAVAERIAYFATDSMPDDALLAAAREGRLQTVADAKREADRLLSTPAGAAKVRDFFRYYTQLDLVADPSVTVAAARGIDPSGLGAELRQEALDYAQRLFDSGADFTALMLQDDAPPSDSSRVQQILSAGPHPGLMHRPALLASTGPRTSPIHRGATLRKQFLCDPLGSPDPNLIAQRQQQVGDLDGLANRDKFSELTSPALCQSCHSQINPLGFAFEEYDPLGMRRDVEALYDSTGAQVQTWPLNTAVSPLSMELGGADSVAGSVALATELSKSFKARGCFAQRAFEYYRLNAVDRQGDGCALAAAEDAAHTGSLRDVLLATLANEDLFYRAEPSP